MTENSKLNLASSSYSCGLEEKTNTPKQNSVSDHKYDSFVIDMESCSSPTSRITRSLSRKGSLRIDKKINSNNTTANHRDSSISCSSPKGPSTPEKPVGAVAGTTGEVHHQITITAGSISATASESKFPLRRNSFKRSGSSPWLDPKRVLLIFASLSSIGTILLIYFTLSINKMSGDDLD